MLHTMYYQDEVRQIENFGTDKVELKDAEVKVAHQLIEALAAKFEPEKYHDTFQDNLKELIKARLEGKEVEAVEKPKKMEPVTDLMSALKMSLDKMEKKGPQRVERVEEGTRTHAVAKKSTTKGRGKKGKVA
jgi:DNA end-binding protein Ku